MVVAKTEFAYKQLQRQFENREVKKRYVAMVQPTLNPSRREGENTSEADKNSLPSGGAGVGSSGTISLPLAPDYLDRPRQVVDYEEGKPAVTEFCSRPTQAAPISCVCIVPTKTVWECLSWAMFSTVSIPTAYISMPNTFLSPIR